jgi:hypothetical protein
MKGIVYNTPHGCNLRKLVGGKLTAPEQVSTYEGVYANMPLSCAEVVRVEENSLTGRTALRSLRKLTLTSDEGRTSVHELPATVLENILPDV